MLNLLDNTPNQPSRYRTKNWIEIKMIHGEQITQIVKFKSMMLTSSVCDYSDAYKFVKDTLTILNKTAAGVAANNVNKKVVINNCAPFTDCISEINNTQVDNAKCIDAVIPTCNLIEYSDNCSKTKFMAISSQNQL